MARATSTLVLLAGATLLVTWLVTPASSAPPPQTPAPRTALDDAMPLLADVDAQVLELHDRIGVRPEYPTPVRDPFSYVTRAPRARAADPRPVSEPVTQPPAEPPMLPALVAILSGDAAASHRAVLSMPDADDVQFVSIGATVGRFVVREIQDDAVVLADTQTNEAARLTLR
ncbi:MAG: hypothetical protein ABI634_08325 [Acidobacteriota bacterium]